MNNETATLLEKHFDLAFAGPKGVQKLRELILTLAMQGKLVPQDPTDRPASELLKDIEAEKQRLLGEGSIKQLKPLPKVKSEEVAYQLPKGWAWARLGEVIRVINGKAYKGTELLDSGTPVLRVGNLFTSKHWYYSDLILEDDKYIDNGDLIYSWSASFGPFIWKGGRVIYHYHIWKLNLFLELQIAKGYIFNFLLKETENIKKTGNGIAMIHMTKERMEKLLIPIPPIAEQHRIVAKIEQLMARCDELETLGTDRTQKRTNVHTAAIDRLLTAKADIDFNTAWNFITQHFSELYSVKENVTELRKAILQLAVMGKLVPQESESKCASLASILAEASINGVSKGPTFDKSATEVLRISAGTSQSDFYVNEDDFKHVALSPSEIQKFKLVAGDLLACRFNGNLHYVGRFSYYRGESGRIQVNPDKLIRFRINKQSHCPRYVCYMMNAKKTRETIEKMCATTAGNIGLSAGKLKTVELPIPPLDAQHRIVAKIDRLMELCDRLDQQIDAAANKQAILLNAVIANI
jgi:type I restriction enzyme S subunit